MVRVLILTITVGCIALGGCVERKLTVQSKPEGALVFLNNQEIGRTPLTREFTYYGNVDAQVRMEGYQTLKTSKQVTAPWWQWPPLDLVAEVLPFRFKDERTIAFTLQPAVQSDDPAPLIDRATELRGKLESSPNTRRPTTTESN